MSTRLLLPVVSLAALSSVATAGETLTMKFQPDEAYGYAITQTMDVEGSVQGQEVKSEMSQTLHISTKVKSVADDGSARAEQTIDRVQMKMVLPAPVSQTLEYDTASEEEPENPIIKNLAANLSNMVGEPIAMTIAPSGEMTDVAIPEKVKQAQQTPGSPLAGNDQLEKLFKQSGLRLPTGEVAVGDTWDQEMEMTLPFGTMQITTTYTYNGKTDAGLHDIGAVMNLELKPVENAPFQVTAETKEASGTFLFDNEAGRLTKSDIKQVLEINLGGVATQNITTNVSMTLTDGTAGTVGTGEEPKPLE